MILLSDFLKDIFFFQFFYDSLIISSLSSANEKTS